jgi:hypothetical protein
MPLHKSEIGRETLSNSSFPAAEGSPATAGEGGPAAAGSEGLGAENHRISTNYLKIRKNHLGRTSRPLLLRKEESFKILVKRVLRRFYESNHLCNGVGL